MKLPDLSTSERVFSLIAYMNQILDEALKFSAPVEEIEAAWNSLDEGQQQGVFELFSVELFRRVT